MPPPDAARRLFPTTHWSMILAADTAEDLRRRALDELARDYWTPLYVYVRRKGREAAEAEDMVQGFYAHLLGQDFLSRLDPARGRFRAYLRMAMDRYLVNQHERATAAKRGGGRRPLSLDLEGVEGQLAHHPPTPEAAFDRAWALEVMGRAQGRLAAELEARNPAAFRAARRFLVPGPTPSYEEAADEAGMSLAGFRSFLHRARQRLRELIRREVTPTVQAGAEVGREVADLMDALRA